MPAAAVCARRADDRRRAVKIVGSAIATLSLIIGTPHPYGSVGLYRNVVIVPVGHENDVAEAVGEIYPASLARERREPRNHSRHPQELLSLVPKPNSPTSFTPHFQTVPSLRNAMEL